MTMPICFLTWWPQLTLENYRQITFLNTSPYKNCLIMVSFHSKRTSSVGKKAWYHSRCLTINTLYLCLSWHTLSRMYGCYKMYWIKQIKYSNFWHSFIWFLVIFILTLFLPKLLISDVPSDLIINCPRRGRVQAPSWPGGSSARIWGCFLLRSPQIRRKRGRKGGGKREI